jgi:hypothetical protein
MYNAKISLARNLQGYMDSLGIVFIAIKDYPVLNTQSAAITAMAEI